MNKGQTHIYAYILRVRNRVRVVKKDAGELIIKKIVDCKWRSREREKEEKEEVTARGVWSV